MELNQWQLHYPFAEQASLCFEREKKAYLAGLGRDQTGLEYYSPINWSLNAIDTIFSTRSLGSGEPDCPDGTFAAGYTMDAWERWRIVCLAALSVEDIEDIYLFGTMITGLLLIGLCFALGYRRIQKTGTAVQSLTRLPVMIEAVERAVSIETETINRNMDSIMEKLTALQRKIDGVGDQNGQRE